MRNLLTYTRKALQIPRHRLFILRRYGVCHLRLQKLKHILSHMHVPRTYAGGTVIMGEPRDSLFFLVLDGVLSVLFAKMGARVYLICDNGYLAHLDMERNYHQIQPRTNTPYQRRFTLDHFPIGFRHHWLRWLQRHYPAIQIVYYSDIGIEINSHLVEERINAMYAGTISQHVDASHRRYFGGSHFDPANEAHVEMARKSILNEAINEHVAERLVARYKPDLFLVLDGIYTTFGPLVSTMRQHGVAVLIYQPNGFTDRHLAIGEKSYVLHNISDHWHHFVAHDDTPAIREAARAFMDRRLNRNGYQRTADDEQWLHFLHQQRQHYDKVIGLFPNLSWDGAIPDRDMLFDGLGAWMKETIEWAAHANVLIVIREHPQSSDTYHTTESSLRLLRELLPDVDTLEHVVLISGLERVRSFELVQEVVDCNVVYNGTMGFEISYIGAPLICPAEAPYSYKGVGYEPQTKQEYFEMLASVHRHSEEFQHDVALFRQNALRACAYQFIYNSYYCPMIPELRAYPNKDRLWLNWDMRPESWDPTKNPEWNRTIQRLLQPLDAYKIG